MLFDREGLEMATHERVSAYHASLFPKRVKVLDLCCGVGGDLIALAGRGPATGVELSAERAELTRHNVAVYELEAEVIERDALQEAGAYAFADPARRQGGTRTLDPRDFSPDPEVLARAFASARLFGMKLSPLLKDAYLEALATDGRLEFISFGGECREALVWLGSEVGTKGRFAVHVESGLRLMAGPPPNNATSPEAWVFEADPASIRAHALNHWALDALGETPGYLTGPEQVRNPWLKAYRVLTTIRGDIKEVQQALAQHQAALPEIKQRGAEVDPSALRKRLRPAGNLPTVLLAYRIGKSVKFVLAEPDANR